MKRILSLLLAAFFTITTVIGATNRSYAINNDKINVNQETTDKDSLALQAKYAVLLDYETGRTLYSKNGNQKLYPASTTKMWTSYMVLKNVSNLNDVIKIEDLPTIEGSSMYLKNGESFTVKQLLDALLVHSSNDAAFVLARYVGKGDVNKFIDMMNEEAQSIGAENTHFNNPHGLPDANHYTTAHDMAIMARKAMSNSVFREIVKTTYIEFNATEAYPFKRYFNNTNQLLTSTGKMFYKGKEVNVKYDIVDGIKTGFTDDAGKCLLSSAVKDDRRVIAAVFNSTNDGLYLDSRTLLDYGFDNYHSETILDKEDYVKTEKVLFTNQKELIYKPKYSYKLTLRNDEKVNEYKIKSKLDKLNLPIKKGDKVGTINLSRDGKKEKSIDLIAQNDLNSSFAFITENPILLNVLKGILLLVVILILVKIGFKIKKKLKK